METTEGGIDSLAVTDSETTPSTVELVDEQCLEKIAFFSPKGANTHSGVEGKCCSFLSRTYAWQLRQDSAAVRVCHR